MNSACIDSNVIIKYYAGDHEARRALEPVISGEITGFINNIIFSEVVFILLKLLANMNAYELKKKPQIIKDIIKNINKQVTFLREYFVELEINEDVKQMALAVMGQYGLLPNDALIAATCRQHGIDTIITFDEDFKRVPWLKVTP
ncbi:MAG: PIN domain-containing protein [Desulfurococcales archaeon]|nr:PIN domain-containing protein [Desulfurococcales archaeon]